MNHDLRKQIHGSQSFDLFQHQQQQKDEVYKFFPKNLCPSFMISIDNAHQVECFVVEKCRNGFPDKVVKM